LIGPIDIRSAGVVLFTTATAISLWLAHRARRRRPDRALAATLVAMASTCLAGAYFLPGSHERYPVHGLALFALLATADPHASRSARALTALGGTLVGLYVLASIHWEVFGGALSVLRGPWPAALTQPLVAASWLAALADEGAEPRRSGAKGTSSAAPPRRGERS
jgi:hypothetical protein